MPTYEITSPEGQKYKITAPEGATQEEILSYARGQFDKPEQSKKPTNLPFTVLNQGAQGLTFGFSDEIADATAAGVASLINGFDYGTNYAAARATSQDQLKRQIEQRPATSILSQIAPAVASGTGLAKAGASVMGKYAPNALTALSNFAKAHPFVTSSGVGAGGAGTYAFGAGEGTPEERALDSLPAAVWGGVLGPLATYGIRQGSAIFKPVVDRTKSALAQMGGQNLVPEQAPKNLATLTQGDDLFPKTTGQRTQNPKLQTLEADALGNRYGEDARNMVLDSISKQSKSYKQFLNTLGKIDDATDANGLIDGVGEVVRKGAKSLKGEVDNAYQLAREGGSVKINADDIREGLLGGIKRIKDEERYNINAMPGASAVLKILIRNIRNSQGKRFTAAKLSSMEHWRSNVSNALKDAQGTEKRFLGQILAQYDDFMYKTANEAVDAGDEEAILAFRNAVGLRRKYGQIYQGNKMVEEIVAGKSADDVTKELIGSGSIAGKKNMVSNYDALIKAAGDNSAAVQADLQTAFAKKIFKRSVTNLDPKDPASEILSPAKLMTELESFVDGNPQFTKKLYGEEGYKVMKQAIKELNLIKTKQPSTGNPSGSGYAVMRLLRDTGFTKVPGLSLVGDAIESASKQSATGKVQKSVSEVLGDIQPNTSGIFSGGAIGAVTGAQDG